MQNKITEILNDNTTTNEEKGKDIGPVRAAYEDNSALAFVLTSVDA
jgi:epidermal growth factor receptor substrate 15